MEFDIKQSAEIQMIEAQKIETEKMISTKDFEINQIKESILVIQKDH